MKTTTVTALAILTLGGILAFGPTVRTQEAKVADKATNSQGAASSFASAKLKNNNGLVAHWKFDEAGESDVCVDASGNGYDGTPHTPIERGEGKVGAHCLSLAGGQVVNLPQTMPFPAAPMSFSAWIKPHEVTGRQYILTYLPNSTETRGEYEFALHLDKGGEPRFWMWGHVAKGTIQEKWGLISKTKLPVSEWAHVAVTIGEPSGETSKPSAKAGAINLTWTMYHNGKPTATAILPVPPFLPNMAYSIGAKPAGEYSLNADIDDLMVFNKTLTAKEVENLYTTNNFQ